MRAVFVRQIGDNGLALCFIQILNDVNRIIGIKLGNSGSNFTRAKPRQQLFSNFRSKIGQNFRRQMRLQQADHDLTVALVTQLQQARQTITLELGDAGWRIAGKQTTLLFRDAVVALLKRTLDPTDQDASMTSRLVGFFESDLGMALLQGALGTALATVPELPNPAAKPYTDVAARLGKECRTEAIALAGNTLVELVMGPLRQVVSGMVQGQQAPAFLPQEAEPLRQLTPPQGVPQAVFIEVKDAQAVPPKKDELLGQKSDG